MEIIITYKLPCSNCKTITPHVVDFSKTYIHPYHQDGFKVSWTFKCEIVHCQSCDTPSFIKDTDCSEWGTGYEQDTNLIEIFPVRSETSVRFPLPPKLPEHLLHMFVETLTAFDNKCYVLCGIGIRALIEGLCKETGSNRGTLEQIIDGLFDQKYILENHKNALHCIRLLGNQAAHGVAPATEKELAAALDVVAHILDLQYNIPKNIDNLGRFRKP